jgi:hypothetical protein
MNGRLSKVTSAQNAEIRGLVADDNAFIRVMMGRLLLHFGYALCMRLHMITHSCVALHCAHTLCCAHVVLLCICFVVFSCGVL